MRVSILGTRVIRTEDPRFLTTGGVYTDDVTDEQLAVVVTENRYQGEDAADLVDVDYDVLPPVVDMAGATASETVLFPAAGSNVAATFGDAAALAAGLFDGCEVVVSRTIVNQRVAPAPMETRAAAAAWGAD